MGVVQHNVLSCDYSPRIRRSDRISTPHFKRESYLNRLGPKVKKETVVRKRKKVLKHLFALAVDPVGQSAVKLCSDKRENARL